MNKRKKKREEIKKNTLNISEKYKKKIPKENFHWFIQNIQDTNPEYDKLVDKYFWDLA